MIRHMTGTRWRVRARPDAPKGAAPKNFKPSVHRTREAADKAVDRWGERFAEWGEIVASGATPSYESRLRGGRRNVTLTLTDETLQDMQGLMQKRGDDNRSKLVTDLVDEEKKRSR